MGDVSKCLDIIVDFFNNGEPKLNAQGYENKIYTSVINETINKILALNDKDRIRAFNSNINNKLQQMTYKNDYFYSILSYWKYSILAQGNSNNRDGYYIDNRLSLDPENSFYRQGDRVLYEYVKRDKDNNIMDKLIAEIKFHDKVPHNNKKNSYVIRK